jgi:hypothetical protein
MTFKVQDNRSNTVNQRPRPDSLLDGQTAINYNDASPGLFFSTEAGALIKAGPVAVSATQPVLAGWQTRSVGEMWLDTSNNTLRIWSGINWITVVGAGTATQTFIPPTSSAGLPSGAVWNNNGTFSIVP